MNWIIYGVILMSDKRKHECKIAIYWGYDESWFESEKTLYEEFDENFVDAPDGYSAEDNYNWFLSVMNYNERRSDYCRFNYCPFCGEKINWNSLLQRAQRHADEKKAEYE